MTTNEHNQDRDLLADHSMAAVLGGGLVQVTGDDEAVSGFLSELAMAVADATEVARLDASLMHSESALAQTVARALDASADDLLAILRQRDEARPLALIIDSGECLGSRALTALRNLVNKGGGGLGVIIGGEPELAELLAQAGIEPARIVDANELEPSRIPLATEEPAVSESSRRVLPWRHMGAVAGLLLLVWLFWAAASDPEGKHTTSLALPEHDAARNVRTAAEASGKSGFDLPLKPEPESDIEKTNPDTVDGAEQSVVQQTEVESHPTTESGAVSGGSSKSNDASEAAGANGMTTSVSSSGAASSPHAYHSEQWLLGLAPGKWMLQLALAADAQRARALLGRLGRTGSAYYQARRNHKTVYIVLAGPYDSHDAASGAIASLPEFLRVRGPFPRDVEAIQQEIRALDGSFGR